MTEQDTAEVADIIADASPLPLLDAAYALWRRRYRLATLEGRAIAEDILVNRALPPERLAATCHCDPAPDGPTFDYVKRAHPGADDNAIRRAIITAVRFEDTCFRYFEQTTAEYWQRCVHAVALSRKLYPDFGEDTYRRAANDVAYYYK